MSGSEFSAIEQTLHTSSLDAGGGVRYAGNSRQSATWRYVFHTADHLIILIGIF